MSNFLGLAASLRRSAEVAVGVILSCLASLHFAWSAPAIPESPLKLQSEDVVAFIGGGDTAAQSESGHIESLLTIQHPGVLFRNLAWEGDTVFSQPREFGFPDLPASLRRADARVVFLQFGRSEALEGKSVAAFRQAYDRLLSTCAAVTPRLVLVTPCPFENGGGLLPSLANSNVVLAHYVTAIHALARERQLPVVDLFAEFGGTQHSARLLTENGLQLSSRGHGLVALAFARQIGMSSLAQRAGEPAANGAWTKDSIEKLRQRILAKNKLWFHYYRPQNWAFLGGDRTSQPSSRDHLNPKHRWFPEEMEKFVPLIRSEEAEIRKLAIAINKA